MCNGCESRIGIYADGKGKWELEAVDDLQIGSIWTEPFDAEQAALEAALAAIEEDSDRAYVGGFFGYRLQ